MYFYNLTLQHSTAINHAVCGNFSGTNEQEIAVSKGKVLEILRVNVCKGTISTVLSTEIFGIIRSMAAFRMDGSSKDYLLIGSDSGSIVIVEYNPQNNIFENVHQKLLGKSGCRKTVPGQFIAVDPKGRAVMIGAVDSQRVVFGLSEDIYSKPVLKNPIKVNEHKTVFYHMVGLDVGSEKPVFACLQLNYNEADNDPSGEAAYKAQQSLVCYELNSSLNQIVQKYHEQLNDHGNHLISVPGGDIGPGGILICSENYITYKNFKDKTNVSCPIPRRRNDLSYPETGVIFVCSATYVTKSDFLILAQTELGDLFKISLETDDLNVVTKLQMKYFDTVPVSSSLCILKSGYLFSASEFGDHNLFQISYSGSDDDDEPVFSSADCLKKNEAFLFVPRSLRYLKLINQLESLSPIMCSKIESLPAIQSKIQDHPTLFVCCGKGTSSSFRILKRGLAVTEVALCGLPQDPDGIWAVKKKSNDQFHSYIVVSFTSATLILAIGKTIEEVTDSGFWSTTPTLAFAQIGDDALVQICPGGIRYIRANKASDWGPPDNKLITKCAVNRFQIVIAHTDGELLYFEVYPNGQLKECEDRLKLNAVCCLALASTEQKSSFLAVGCMDKTIRIISLHSFKCSSVLCAQVLPSIPESIVITEKSYNIECWNSGQKLYDINIGLKNGALLQIMFELCETVLENENRTYTGDWWKRRTANSSSGTQVDTKLRYLGSRPVRLYKVCVEGIEAVLAISNRAWLSYFYQNRFHVTPLLFGSLEHASSFSSEECPEGIVAISDSHIRLLTLEKLETKFNQALVPLQYTPRKFSIHYPSKNVYVIGTDHNSFSFNSLAIRREEVAQDWLDNADENEKDDISEMGKLFINEGLPEGFLGSPRAGIGMWASAIIVVSPHCNEIIYQEHLEQNEAALSMCLVQFESKESEQFLLVGIVDYPIPKSQNSISGSIHTYQIGDDSNLMTLVHKTPVEHAPTAICPFQGKVVIGVGKELIVFDMGKLKLLKKSIPTSIPNRVVTIQANRHCIIVGDVEESISFHRFDSKLNKFKLFAVDTIPRWITTACFLDSKTAAGADKFGNIFVIRIPFVTDYDAMESSELPFNMNREEEAPQKAEIIACFYVGGTVLTMQKAVLVRGGTECLVYATLSGAIGILAPFTQYDEHDFFQRLETCMRTENSPLCGRDHLSFRSYYFALKNVIDGDLCEQFNFLKPAKQTIIEKHLDKSSLEIIRRVEEIRNKYAF